MDQPAKFPTFECVISNTVEEYDSEVEFFFLVKNYLLSTLSRLTFLDPEWKDNYFRAMKFLSDLSNSLVHVTEPPSHDFLVKLSLVDEIEDNQLDRLIRSKSETAAVVVEASTRTRELMYWYVKNSRVERFSKSFNPTRFQGLPFLRLALTYRSIQVSKK